TLLFYGFAAIIVPFIATNLMDVIFTAFNPPYDMKEFFSHIRGAVVSTLVLAIVCCGLYPLIVFAISQTFFYEKANGSLILDKDGAVRGSKLLAQGFTADKYFHPRPSAAGNGYDATSSG